MLDQLKQILYDNEEDRDTTFECKACETAIKLNAESNAIICPYCGAHNYRVE